LCAIIILYVWVASRQVRPRKIIAENESSPTSPDTKRLRKRMSMSMDDIDLKVDDDVQSDEDDDDDIDALWLKDRNWNDKQLQMYNGLTKMFFSSFENEFMQAIIRYSELQLLC